MCKTAFTLLGATLMIAATMPLARAAQRHHHVHNASPPAAVAPFRNSNNAIAPPDGSTAPQLPSYYSGGYSAPAGQ
jgi:hypothetical protein